MNENKRFTDVWCSETGEIGLTDNGVDKTFYGDDFEKFLNKLNEENELLHHYFRVCGHHRYVDSNIISDLKKENEQLKQEIKTLEDENESLENRLWNCRHVR